MYDRQSIREGMTVHSSDGHKLGKVFAIGDAQFQIEKGLFFPKDYLVRYGDVADIRGDDLILRISKEELKRGADYEGTERYAGAEERPSSTPISGIGTGVAPTTGRHDDIGLRERHAARSEKDIAVPVVEEELDAVKREREAGQVRIHKTVETQHKTVEVPVRQEKVTVERVAATDRHAATGDAFHEESISVPVHTEEVEVRKRPVVKEEVRVRKDAFEQERRVAADVRKEKVDVRTEGEVDETRRSDIPGKKDPNTRY
jgi:uncharacterized protein (TIGR02271 family)